MPLFPVNAEKHGLDTSDRAVAAWLAAHPGAPVVVMIHGFRFRPGDPAHCPHDHILSDTPRPGRPRAVSWPRHLGLGRGGPATADPLCIAFGWSARGSIWRAWRESRRAGAALALLLCALHRADPGRPVGVIAHSLGARVALSALGDVPPGAVGRMVLIAGAARRRDAAAALVSPAANRTEVVNITSRENALFDAALRMALLSADRTVGAGMAGAWPNWVDLRIDHPDTRSRLARLGFRIAAPRRRVCHWSGYLRPGLFALYRRVLCAPAALPLTTLAKAAAHGDRRRVLPLLAEIWKPRPGAVGQTSASRPG